MVLEEREKLAPATQVTPQPRMGLNQERLVLATIAAINREYLQFTSIVLVSCQASTLGTSSIPFIAQQLQPRNSFEWYMQTAKLYTYTPI